MTSFMMETLPDGLCTLEEKSKEFLQRFVESPAQQKALGMASYRNQCRREMKQIWQSETVRAVGVTVEDLLDIILSSNVPDEWFAITQSGLSCLDSRAFAALLKELCRKGRPLEAFKIFDWLRSLETNHKLAHLLDVYTYTTMIAQCGSQEKLHRAMEFLMEMRERNIKCNVHTYTALMHVYTKTDNTELALRIPELMKKDGCMPNLVTFNTLINLFRKMGQWKRAVDVIDILDELNIQAEAKTYNSVISACSSNGEPAQALYVYKRMLGRNVKPSATTYTALISAHGKKGLVEDAVAIFQDMVQRGCERNVITYSSLIGACEKTGEWKLAFDLFLMMRAENIRPNIVTFNSLITTCSNGSQWARACEIYDYMIRDDCYPDQTTYTLLLGMLMKGEGPWTSAMKILEDMSHYGYGRLDNAAFHAVMDILWNSGEKSAQIQAFRIWKEMYPCGFKTGNNRQRAEFTVEVFTCGSALIAVLMWLREIGTLSMSSGGMSLVMKCGKRSFIDHTSSQMKDAVSGILEGWKVPFVVSLSDHIIQLTPISERHFAECLYGGEYGSLMRRLAEMSSNPSFTTPLFVEQIRLKTERSQNVYESILAYEATQKFCPIEVINDLMKDRSSIVQSALHYASGLGFKERVAIDAIWLFGRFVASGKFSVEHIRKHKDIIICVCVLSIGTSVEPKTPFTIPKNFGFLLEVYPPLKTLYETLFLGHDFGVLDMFVGFLGGCGLGFFTNKPDLFHSVIIQLALHPISMQLPPSLIACIVLYGTRRMLNLYPHWPSQIAELTHTSTSFLDELMMNYDKVFEVIVKTYCFMD